MTEDEYLESLARFRAATDSGRRWTLAEVAARLGFDPDELAAEAAAELADED